MHPAPLGVDAWLDVAAAQAELDHLDPEQVREGKEEGQRSQQEADQDEQPEMRAQDELGDRRRRDEAEKDDQRRGKEQ
jgi:hypothetical protein